MTLDGLKQLIAQDPTLAERLRILRRTSCRKCWNEFQREKARCGYCNLPLERVRLDSLLPGPASA